MTTVDMDGNGVVDFDEYLCVMVTYCMYTKDEIMRFCFECFDVDQSGYISRSGSASNI